ncbi:helix-turn-helix domain-containing protein [Streptomyces sp. NPDC002520]
MTQEPEPDWSARLALSVAREVRRHRQAKGWSAQQLSDRCAEIGMPIQRSVLANLESGRRTTVTIAEISVLAAALEVPPLSLVYPAGYEKVVEGLPGRHGDAYDWAFWFSGEELLPGEENEEAEGRLLAFPMNRARSIQHAVMRHLDANERYIRRMEKSLAEVHEFNHYFDLYKRALDEAEKIISVREGLIKSIAESDDPKVMQAASERRRILEKEAQEALRRARSLEAKLDERKDDEREIELYRLEVEAAKVNVRKALDDLKSDGWLEPEIPDYLVDLFDSSSGI